MKEQILDYLREHPESRKRTIASVLKIWVCDKDFGKAMRDLEEEGKITSTYHHDSANMEFYDTYSVEKR